MPHATHRVVPKFCRSCLIVVAKLCQSFAKVVSKFSQICPMVVLKLSQSRPRAVSKLSPNCFKWCSRVVHVPPKRCPNAVPNRCQVVSKLSKAVAQCCLCTVYFWSDAMWSSFSFGHEMYWVNVFDLAAEARMSLLWRNGVIVKSGMQDWRRVGMAITAPCDHFVDSWQPLLDNFGFFWQSYDVHLVTFYI